MGLLSGGWHVALQAVKAQKDTFLKIVLDDLNFGLVITRSSRFVFSVPSIYCLYFAKRK